MSADAYKMESQSAHAELLQPFTLGALELPNRMVMASMTRSRASAAGVPSPLAPLYYSQRASAGLIVAEGSPVSPQAVGYVCTPGIYTQEQVLAWREVTAAVHRAQGRIVLQLWHVGRASHPDFHGGELPVAPSAIAAEGKVFTPSGLQPIPVPRALELDEMPGIVEQFRRAAVNAKAAGFDGVEIQGGNGYLLDQFLRDGPNKRSDAYGGTLSGRARLPVEIAEAVIGVWGRDRVGYKISPWTRMLSVQDSNTVQTFVYLAQALESAGICYLDVIEREAERPVDMPRLVPVLNTSVSVPIILGGGYDAHAGAAAVRNGDASLIAYGALFLANPDLPRRFREDAAFNKPDQASFYQGGEQGYVDYPAMAE